MKKFNIVITAYLSIIVLSNTHCSDMKSVKESTALESLEAEIIDQIQKLKANGINATDSQGRTPLFLAAQYNQVAIIQELLQDNDIEVNKPDNNGLTPLAIAVNECHKDIVKLLIDNKVDVNTKTRCKLHGISEYFFHNTSEFYYFGYGFNIKSSETPLHCAAREGHKDIVALLIKAGADVNIQDKQGSTSLHWAALRGHKDIVQMLLNNKVNINAKDVVDYTALHNVAIGGSKDIIELLIKAGADVNAKTWDNQTSLHKAAEYGNKDVIDVLIKNKAYVNAKDNCSDTPLDKAILYDKKEVAETLIKARIKEDVLKQLIDSNDDINNDNYNKLITPQIAQLLVQLLENDVNATDKEGRTPLFIAAQYNKASIIKALLKSKDVEVNKADNDGLTPLAIAVNEGHKEAVQALLDDNSIALELTTINKQLQQLDENETAQNKIIGDTTKEITNLWSGLNSNEGDLKSLIAASGQDLNVESLKQAVYEADTDMRARIKYAYEILNQLKEYKQRLEQRKVNLLNKKTDAVSKNKPDLEARDNRIAYTPLMRAAQTGHVGIVKLLLAAGANPTVSVKRNERLVQASNLVAENHSEITDLIKDKQTEYTYRTLLFIKALRDNKPDEAKKLFMAGIDFNTKDQDVYTPLIWAATYGYKDIVQMLIEAKADVNTKYDNGSTPLICAARDGHKDIVQMLIEAKADVNAKDQDGWTSLHWATNKNHKEIVDMLKKAGAKDNKNCVIC